MSEKNINKLQKVQNIVARVITGRRKFDHISSVIRDLHWLPVKFRIKFKLCTIVFKTLSTKEPVYLRELLVHCNLDRTLRSTDQNFLFIPRCKTVMCSRAFAIAAPTLWNKIPLDIRNSESLATFKKISRLLFLDSLTILFSSHVTKPAPVIRSAALARYKCSYNRIIIIIVLYI